jgi:hypothetical protein
VFARHCAFLAARRYDIATVWEGSCFFLHLLAVGRTEPRPNFMGLDGDQLETWFGGAAWGCCMGLCWAERHIVTIPN